MSQDSGKYDVLIIGAGAAGLMAMCELIKAGHKVAILEATGTAGGRIRTQRWQQFDHGVEYGAEFIHGDAPLTFELLKKAGVPYTKVTGNMISVRHGVWLPESQQEMYNNTLLEKLELIQEDCSIQDFLDAYLPKEEYEQTRNSVQQFAEGFGLCDITKASISALKKEWKNLEADQYRIEDGYIKLINYLVQTCTHPLGTFHFYAAVNQIDYQPGQVIVHTVNGCRYTAPRIIVTVSAGVLQAGDIRFDPPLREHGVAIQQLPFGSVIKVLLGFDQAFQNNLDDIGFLLTDEPIPTWWTQLPSKIPLLTGWLGGPFATKFQDLHADRLLQIALSSLSHALNIENSFLRRNLLHHQIICWGLQNHIKGGYSYVSPDSENAKRILRQPVDDAIFFAGEALHIGESQATVEAALSSGKEVAEMISKTRTSPGEPFLSNSETKST